MCSLKIIFHENHVQLYSLGVPAVLLEFTVQPPPGYYAPKHYSTDALAS